MTDIIENVNSNTIIETSNSDIITETELMTSIVNSIEGYVVQEQEIVNLIETGMQGPAGGEEEVPYTKYVDFIDDDHIYIGEAIPGTATSSPAWRIKYIVIALDGDVTTTWADGDSSFNNIYDNRASYSYS